MKCAKCGYTSEFKLACPCGWKVSTITGLYEYANVEDLGEKILKLIDELKEHPVLTLKGEVGIGKTHAAVSMAKYWAHKTGLVKAGMYLGTAVSRLPSAIDDYLGTIHDREKAYSAQHIVILDDFVVGMSGVLEYRITERLPTLITTNEDIDAAFGKRIASRLSAGVRTFQGNFDKRGDVRFAKKREERSKQYRVWEEWKDTPANRKRMSYEGVCVKGMKAAEALRKAKTKVYAEGRG